MTFDGVTARDDKGSTLDVTTSKRTDALSVTMQTEDRTTRMDFHLSRHYAAQLRDRLNRFLGEEPKQPTIEILHTRDPDMGCEHSVFVDGEPASGYIVEDIDPGRGYQREDWDEYTETVKVADYSPVFKAAVLAERDSAAESSQYIVEEGKA